MTAPIDEFRALVRVVATLREPDGCPWDREQRLPDISRHLLEETAEVADAVDLSSGRPDDHVREELGDVLMNVLLASRIAEEDRCFGIDDVCRTIREKLIRRHPHVVFDAMARQGLGDPSETERVDGGTLAGKVTTSAEVLVRWQAIKDAERAARSEPRPASRLATVPRSLPPLARAQAISAAAAKVGFDWPTPRGSLDKVREELAEVAEILEATELLSRPTSAREIAGTAEIDAATRIRLEEELGDVLFAAVNLCRKLGVDADTALRRTLKKFSHRFETIERRLPDLESATLAEMDAVWDEVRARDRAAPRVSDEIDDRTSGVET
jgi:uncharacterized protein YabN with tetrapyrrole methylase and pyrophosphatase domain